MQFEVTVDAKALTEATRMMRRWHYWPRTIAQSGYFFLLLGVMIWGLFFNLISSQGSLQKAGLCAVVSALLIALWAWQSRRSSRKIKVYLNGINPVRFNIQTDGVSMTERVGTSSFIPWREFSSFREGKGIFLLNRLGSGGFQIVPKEGLPAHEIDRLRSQFVAQIPTILK
jgi:hypothetical protein